jgi:Mor family transcriptional regulator
MSKNGLRFMADLADKISSKLSKKLNMAPSDAANIGLEVAENLRRFWSGQSVYIPKTDKKALAAKYSEILETYMAPGDAANIGNEVAEGLRSLWSGQSIYIPKTDKKALAAKYSDIVEAKKKEGITPRLCHKFGLTKQRMYQIVASEMRKHRKKVP